MKKNKGIALFVMPRSSYSWRGSEALWITVSGWAAAAERKFGKSYIITTDRIANSREGLNYPLGDKNNQINKKNGSSISSYLPTVLITFIKDVLLWRSSKSKRHYNFGIPDFDNKVTMVWEQHDFFPGIGYELSIKHNVPFIIYVHAPQVWESSKWGVKRPFWGGILEKMEAKSLKRADVVACVSEQVAGKLKEMGIPENKILVSPMAVDAHLFENSDSENIVKQYNLQDKFIIGWTGSFRSFHGLDILLKVFKNVHQSVNSARLLLVGDGFEKERMMGLAEDLDISDYVIFTGRKSFVEIPNFVNSFDLAIVSARKASDFHYSPLKLREYLGAGIPTMAPFAGEIPIMFKDNVHLKLYNIGEIEDTAQKIVSLYKDKAQRDLLAIKGKEFILNNGTWDVELENLSSKLI